MKMLTLATDGGFLGAGAGMYLKAVREAAG